MVLLGTMLGGYNVSALVELLDDANLGAVAAEQLAHTLLVFDAFHDVAARATSGNPHALAVMRSWAAAEWFTRRPAAPAEIHLTVFKVEGEVTPTTCRPRPHAWSRADIPLHALSFLENRTDAGDAIRRITELRAAGRPIAFVGDVVGTGSSRKSAVNSLLWHIGDDIPYVPNKRQGGVVLGSQDRPDLFHHPAGRRRAGRSNATSPA